MGGLKSHQKPGRNDARALIVPGARNVGRVCALCVTGVGGSRGSTSAFANDAPHRTGKFLRCGGGCGRVQALQQHRRISRIFRARGPARPIMCSGLTFASLFELRLVVVPLRVLTERTCHGVGKGVNGGLNLGALFSAVERSSIQK
jgi:hypothetical protein